MHATKEILRKLNPLHVALKSGRNLKFLDLLSDEALLERGCVRRSKIFSIHVKISY
jgi:hypothetical protein